jgi:hypothetical protein
MNVIELQVKAFLERVVQGEAEMPPHVIEEAVRQFRRLLERQFSPRSNDTFRLRLSNIGQPVCQLWHKKNGTEAEPRPYNFPMKMAFGDAVEIIAMAVLKSAGADIEGINEAGQIEIGGETIRGTSDITISGKIWDIKGVSKVAFERTYSSPYGYRDLSEDDPFGYLAQGVGYSIALGKPFGGWLVINKESGEFAVLEMPEDDLTSGRQETLDKMTATVEVLKSDEKPPRQFEDVPEKHNKKPTGNRMLSMTCKYCDFKAACWPDLQHLPAQMSTARSPDYRWYTHVESSREA